MNIDKSSKHYLHKEFPKTKAADDFWGQVCRTVNGKPVSEKDIQSIVKAIENNLFFQPTDVLLDIGCGNGALSNYFFNKINGFLGVDFSEYLIQIAKDNFEKIPDYRFIYGDAAGFIYSGEQQPERYTKMLCYGAFAYLPFEDAKLFLNGLNEKFINIEICFIGNLPDKDRANLFYPKNKDYYDILDNSDSPIGIWRTKQDMANLAADCGWKVDFHIMPNSFYAAHYRYDVTLTRL